MKKETIIIIVLVFIIIILSFFLFNFRNQSNECQNSKINLANKNSRLFSEKDKIVGCFSNEISSIEMCLLNCHDLSCYQKCKISNNDVLDKCYRNED